MINFSGRPSVILCAWPVIGSAIIPNCPSCLGISPLYPVNIASGNTLLNVFNINEEINKSYSFHCKNSSNNLANIINKNNKIELSNNCPTLWVPPKTNGLKNSNRIIPEYYINRYYKNNGILEIDYLFMIIDDIRNSRKLNEYQLTYFKNLDDKNKVIILNELFNSHNYLIDYIELVKSTVNSHCLSRNNSPDYFYNNNQEI